jgi:hypothetical protein
MSEPNYIKCSCQNCNGHIKFDSNLLRVGETRKIECPHCHLETTIFYKQNESNSSDRTSVASAKGKSSKVELILFELTRFPTIGGAILLLLALVVTTFWILQTKLPEKKDPQTEISYDLVDPLVKTPTRVLAGTIPQGSKMAAKNAFPQPVVDFLLKHQKFSLKLWLDQLDSGQRKAFLNNLATILVTANSKNLTDEQFENVVKDFAELWIVTDKVEQENRAQKELKKQIRFNQLTTVAFGIFISLVSLCLVLVMLAIERNTRTNQKSKN